MLQRIKEDWTHVVTPVIDVINDNDFNASIHVIDQTIVYSFIYNTFTDSLTDRLTV